MVFAENDYMVQTLAPDSADQPFHIGRLPRTMWGCHHFLNPHSRHSPTEFFAVNLIPISEEEARRSAFIFAASRSPPTPCGIEPSFRPFAGCVASAIESCQ